MRMCAYTVLFGQYDALIEPPVTTDPECDYICFTDDPELKSDGWDVRVVPRTFAEDPIRSARMVKILGHDDLLGYDASLYIDASVRLRQNPSDIIRAWLGDDDEMALARHSYREQLIDEFDEVIRLNYDDRARVYEQMTDYAVGYPTALETVPLWTGMLVRRHTSSVASAMRTWANHVLRYSRRDQLSVAVALAASGVRYRALDVDNFDSETHQWPAIERRRILDGKAPVLPPGPLVADLRRSKTEIAALKLRIGELDDEIAELGQERFARLVETERTLRALIEELRDVELSFQDAQRSIHNLQERLEVLSSLSGAAGNLRNVVAGRLRRRR